MKILFITTGFPPYMFSENIVNGKLVLAFKENNWQVDVISKKEDVTFYSNDWDYPFDSLKESTFEIEYQVGNKVERVFDYLKCSLLLGLYSMNGNRWAFRAYRKALQLATENNYDFIISRSPDDIAHLVALKLKNRKKINWIANWNDPAQTIWPQPYKLKLSLLKRLSSQKLTKNVLKKANYLTFPSDNLLKHFENNFKSISKAKSKVIPHIEFSNLNLEKIENNNSKAVKLCHSGNLSIERNPELLFKAIAEINENIEIKIYLDIFGKINSYSMDLIKKYKLNNYINFLGSFNYFDSIKLLNNYDYLVLVEAEMENGIFFPSKVVDYFQCNKPIISISPVNGFMKDLSKKEDRIIFIENTNYMVLVNTLKQLINNPFAEKIEKSDLFSSERVLDIYSELFQNN